MTTKAKFSFRDRLWVLQAFLRGKVLRQKGYRPNGNIFPAPPSGTTVKRMILLIRWWGFQPATLEELAAFMNQPTTPRPMDHPDYLNWDGAKWHLVPGDGNWGYPLHLHLR